MRELTDSEQAVLAERLAHNRLHIAAPDLLEALRNLVLLNDMVEGKPYGFNPECPAIHRARVAIAKATGEIL